MAIPVLEAVRSARDHVLSHPDAILKAAIFGLRRQIAIPLDAVRWALAQIPPGKNAPEAVSLRAVPPGLRFDATVAFMGNRLESSATLEVEDVRLGGDRLILVLRVRDLAAKALTPNTPIAQVLASGALDLRNPANMLNFMGKRPPVIVDAKGDRFELDLLQVPKLRDNRALRRILATAAPVFGLTTVRTEGDWLLIGWRPILTGIGEALAAARG
ncbi:MAG: hypothetical protein H6746_19385 [Deltaproteobacteria bacterium]|nr:hypothetical protein [Deltaproteobacteria bacterium]